MISIQEFVTSLRRKVSGGVGVGKGGGLPLPPPDGVLLELLELKPSVECSGVQCTKGRFHLFCQYLSIKSPFGGPSNVWTPNE